MKFLLNLSVERMTRPSTLVPLGLISGPFWDGYADAAEV